MFSRILGLVLLALIGSCGPAKKEPRYLGADETVPFEEFRPDFNDPVDTRPYQPGATAPRSFGQEPDKVFIAGDYRQDNNNTVLMEVDQTLLAKFTGFSLPVIPKGGTQRLVPEFPQSWLWNAAKDQYETVGRTTRPDGSLENVNLVAKTYPNFDFLDVSMSITVRPGDQISSTLALVTAPQPLRDLSGGESFSRRSDRDRGCGSDHDDDDHDRDDCDYPRPRPRPQPCPYPEPDCPSYPDGVCDNTCPNDPDCRPRCPSYPDGQCDGSCPNDPDCKPQCPSYPDGRCDGSCPNDPDCKPQCPTGCTQCCCDCTGEQAQEKTFLYKFKKID